MNSQDIANKIQLVVNTLQTIQIQASYENMDKLMGSLKLLAIIKEDMLKLQDDETEGENQNGRTNER